MVENTLSCFIDEAGDFGGYEAHSPYYIVSVITHEQADSIQAEINGLEKYLASLGYAHHAIHTAPLIRREGDYKYLDIELRKKLFNLLFRFTRKCPLHFFAAQIKKSECADSDILEAKITKEIKAKIDIGQFSNSEKEFFSSPHLFKKDYWRKLSAQRM